MSDEEMTQAKEAQLGNAEIFSSVSTLCQSGYKISVSRDNYGGGFQAFMTSSLPDDPNFGFTLTSRAPHLEAALSVLLWKHFTLFGTLWPHDKTAPKGGGWG